MTKVMESVRVSEYKDEAYNKYSNSNLNVNSCSQLIRYLYYYAFAHYKRLYYTEFSSSDYFSKYVHRTCIRGCMQGKHIRR